MTQTPLVFASFALDIPFLLPFLGIFIIFLTSIILAPNVKRFSWIAVIFFGYLPAWCFRKYLDPNVTVSLLTAIFVSAVAWASATESSPLVSRKKMLWILSVSTIFLVWLLSGALYFDYLNLNDLIWFNIGEAGRGNHFMWNSGLDWLFGWQMNLPEPTYNNPFWHTVAMFLLFVLYPLILLAGIKIGQLLFGRSSKQIGILGNF